MAGGVELFRQLGELIHRGGRFYGSENISHLGGAVKGVETVVPHRGQELCKPASQPLTEEGESAVVKRAGPERGLELMEGSASLLKIEQDHASSGVADGENPRPLELLLTPVWVFDRRLVLDVWRIHGLTSKARRFCQTVKRT